MFVVGGAMFTTAIQYIVARSILSNPTNFANKLVLANENAQQFKKKQDVKGLPQFLQQECLGNSKQTYGHSSTSNARKALLQELEDDDDDDDDDTPQEKTPKPKKQQPTNESKESDQSQIYSGIVHQCVRPYSNLSESRIGRSMMLPVRRTSFSPQPSRTTFTFIGPTGFDHPETRGHVRLLGPCFKTGRMEPYGRQHARRVVCEHRAIDRQQFVPTE